MLAWWILDRVATSCRICCIKSSRDEPAAWISSFLTATWMWHIYLLTCSLSLSLSLSPLSSVICHLSLSNSVSVSVSHATCVPHASVPSKTDPKPPLPSRLAKPLVASCSV